jgi:hypothetical protein
VILSYGFESIAASNTRLVVEYLLGDARRFCLGELDADAARSVALLESIRSTVSASDVQRLETAIAGSLYYSESAEGDARARAFAMNRNREHHLRLFQCLPAALLTSQRNAQIEQEARVFGQEGRMRSRSAGFRAIGSPMSSAQMDLAADEHILGLFEELPDGTRFHPTRMMDGGAEEAAREFASLAKRNPQRALALISRLHAGKNETPVATALDALSETALSGAQLFEIIAACHERGFASKDFRTEAARCLGKRAGREEGIPESALTLLQEWLAQVPTAPRTVPRPTSVENTGSPPFLYSTGGFTAIPGGSYAFLDALLIAYLSASPPRTAEWLAILSSHLERDEDPLIWRAFSRRLVHLERVDRAVAGRFVTALFLRYPEVLESGAGVVLAAHASGWVDANIVQGWATHLRGCEWQYAQSAAGEFTAFLALRNPPLEWAQQRLGEITTHRTPGDQALGAAQALMGAWRDPALRVRACGPLTALIVQAIPTVDALILERLAFDELSGDLPSEEILVALAARVAPPPLDHAHDLASWISEFAQTRPDLVRAVLVRLLASAEAEADGGSRLLPAAEHLVKITLTLQRLPEFRDVGLSMFEQLLGLGVYGTHEALAQIDFARR